MKNIYAKTFANLFALIVVMALALFAPAGTVRYWQAWVYLAIYIVATVLITLYLIRRDPALLERRNAGGPMRERQAKQKVFNLFASIGFVALMIVPALDRRFGWSSVAAPIVIAGDVLTAAGLWLIFLVFRANTFASATIELAESQEVISTGPYALVRHPMYASGLLFLIGTPLALGSYWGLVAVAFTTLFLVLRLLDEEKFLASNLPGYVEYQRKVHHHLVPYMW